MAAPFHNPWLLADFISRDSAVRPGRPAPGEPIGRPGQAPHQSPDRHIEPSSRRRWGELAFVGSCAAGFMLAAGGLAYGVFSLFA
jgi:hypothetical protein